MRIALVMACVGSALLCGCTSMVISTGTTIGLKATPGDGSTQTPQVTFGYKRMELAYVPVEAGAASKSQPARKTAKAEAPPAAAPGETQPAPADVDAFSALAVIDVQTKWFGRTVIKQFISSGIAAREISANNEFANGFAEQTTNKARASREMPENK
jgi:hypothetical protein